MDVFVDVDVFTYIWRRWFHSSTILLLCVCIVTVTAAAQLVQQQSRIEDLEQQLDEIVQGNVIYIHIKQFWRRWFNSSTTQTKTMTFLTILLLCVCIITVTAQQQSRIEDLEQQLDEIVQGNVTNNYLMHDFVTLTSNVLERETNPFEFFPYDDVFKRILQNLLIHWSMNCDQFKCSLCYLCLCCAVLAPLSLTVGSNTFFHNFLLWIL